MATKLAMRWKGEKGVDKWRKIREGAKTAGRAAQAVGEAGLYTAAAAGDVTQRGLGALADLIPN